MAVLRLGLLLPFGRIYHYLNLYLGQGDWCAKVTGPDHCPLLPHCLEGTADDPQQINGYGDPICCAGYPCQWCGHDMCAGEYWINDVPKIAAPGCVAIKTGAKCTEDGDLYLAETVLFPQLAAQLFYCWLLSVSTRKSALLTMTYLTADCLSVQAYIKNKRAGALLADVEDAA